MWSIFNTVFLLLFPKGKNTLFVINEHFMAIITKLFEEVERADNCISNTGIENAAIKKPKPICWFLTCIKIYVTKALLFLRISEDNQKQESGFVF